MEPRKPTRRHHIHNMIQNTAQVLITPIKIHKKSFYQTGFSTQTFPNRWILGIRAGDFLGWIVDRLQEEIDET